MKKILITGGAGFIGSEIVNQLFKEEKYEVTVFDALTEQIHGKNATRFPFWRERGNDDKPANKNQVFFVNRRSCPSSNFGRT